MKIALYCQFDPGTAEHILQADRARALVRLGHKPFLLTQPFKRSTDGPRVGRRIEWDGWTERLVYTPRCLLLSAAWQSLLLAFGRFDLVILQKCLPLALWYALWLRLWGQKKLLVIADDWEGVGGFATANRRPWLQQVILTACEEALPRLARWVWCVSEPLFTRWQHLRGPKLIVYVPNGGRAVSEQPPVVSDGREMVVCHVGTYKSQEQVAFLATLITTTARKRWAVKYIMVGGGPLFSAFKEAVGSLPCVTFTGPIPHEQALAEIAAADVCLLRLDNILLMDRSRSSVKMFEYMAAGKAIVASSEGEAARLLRNKETALLVGNEIELWMYAIGRYLYNAQLREQYGKAAQAEFEERFAHERILEAILRKVGDNP
jgi:glycosyltransferase involved in cell wall biosynthesis